MRQSATPEKSSATGRRCDQVGHLPPFLPIRRGDFESVINNGFVKGYDVARSVQQLLRVVARLLFFGSAYIIIGVYLFIKRHGRLVNVGPGIFVYLYPFRLFSGLTPKSPTSLCTPFMDGFVEIERKGKRLPEEIG